MTSRQPSNEEVYSRLDLRVAEQLLPRFFLLLQQGVGIRRRVGRSVEAFLLQEMGIAPGTIEKIQSIMLDGKPVDDIRRAVVHHGSTLALSAAMPGLVGATLRRGGVYSSLRSGITYHETEAASAVAEGRVRIKIFNLLMAEMGPGLLRTGVLASSESVLGLLKERDAELRAGCRSALDGKAVDIDDLENLLAGTDEVFFTVSG